jgi:hypothetical protein
MPRLGKAPSLNLAALVIALPAGAYRAEWINAISGQVETRADLQHPGGDAFLRAPAGVEEMALRIRAL